MNKLMQFASVVDPARWAFEGLLVLDANNRNNMEIRMPVMKKVDFAENYFPIEKERTGGLLIAFYLLIQLGVLIAGILMILKSRDVL